MRYRNRLFSAGALFLMAACSALPQQFNEAKKDPDLACSTYRPDPAQVTSAASKEIASITCDGSHGCVSTNVESIEYENKGASVNSMGWLMCPAVAKLPLGKKVHGIVNLYLLPQESSLRFTWASDHDSILALRSPDEVKRDQTTTKCTDSASAFSFAATFRDTGISPQETLARMKAPAFRRGFPDAALKEIINMVYFDPDLSRWSASRIYSAVSHDCLAPRQQFAPLQ
ncbi:hypothetical protein AAB988_29565 [Burkholderia contaminans]|uniref:hypothetical protein n=1 Tax=Burkholderia contaminans TaxID=488447 RepID=UPI0031120724